MFGLILSKWILVKNIVKISKIGKIWKLTQTVQSRTNNKFREKKMVNIHDS